MDKKKTEDLRKKLDSKIIELIAPKEMDEAEYKIQCNLNGVDATVENGMFLHWVMTAHDGEETDVEDKVHDAIVQGLKQRCLIDVDNPEQCAYFCDAVKHLLLEDKDYLTRIIDAVLNNYKHSSNYGLEVFNFCKQLNKTFGFTSTEYFDYDGFKDALLINNKSRQRSKKTVP